MLSRLLFVRLKAAENALRDGRLDDAYRLATAPDIREHRRGAAVLAGLTERFLERARHHFRADRFTEALMDLDRAETGGVMKEQIAELRDHVRTVAAELDRQERSRQVRVEAARRRIEGGSLAAGRKILEHASKHDPAAQELRRVVDDRADDAAQIIEQAERLINAGQLAAAAQRLRRARTLDAQSDAVARVESRLCTQVLENARRAVLAGKLRRASDELGCLGELGRELPARGELADALSIAREAARCVRDDRFGDARRHALGLSRLLPDAPWVREIIEQLRQVEEISTALCSGPLGDYLSRPTIPAEKAAVRPMSLDETVALPFQGRAEGTLPQRLLLLVDGGGSYLILLSDHVSLGRAASRRPPDIPVFSDLAERHANLNRVEDDYFLISAKEVEVAGRKTKHQLLRDGDRIVLGRKAKFTFRLPSRKSPSAVLDLSDTTKMPNDTRRVILFHRHASVGTGPHVHIRCSHAGPSLLLFERNGGLWMRQKSDGHVDTEPVALRLGELIEIAGASLVLKPWEAGTMGGPKA